MKIDITGKSVTMTKTEGDTEQLRRIVSSHLPAVMERFARKNRAYGENEFDLGAAGQFPEVWRKVKLLRDQLWSDRTAALSVDSTEETAGDLIGHLLMLLDCIAPRSAPERGSEGVTRPVRTPAKVGPHQGVSDSVGHSIREAKAGPESWVDSQGRVAPEWGQAMMSSEPRSWSIRVAGEERDRCQATGPAGLRCVGVDLHTRRNDEPLHVDTAGRCWA